VLVLLAACTKAAAPVPDAGPPDAGPPPCMASSLSGFQPSAWVPPRPVQKVCTSDDIDTYWNVCVMLSALPIQCQQFVANHAACAACLSPTGSDGGTGPLLAKAGAVDVNVGGCIALGLADSSAQGCGAREQQVRDCVSFACAGCDGGACDARQGVCADYQMRTCGELGGAAPCTLSNGAMADYQRIAAVFCNAGP
jgi:hypothetical protein